MIRVVIVDDHPIVRQGLAHLLSQQSDIVVCGEAEDAAEAIRIIDEKQPDIVIADLSLKTTSGLELIKHLRASDSKTPVLVLSMHDEAHYVERTLRAGAAGYLTKQEASAKVVDAVRCVL